MLKEIEALLRAGKFGEASRRLPAARPAAIPRRDVLGYANAARRLGAFPLALRILSPFVHGTPTRPPSASTEERIEYAASLIKVGAPAEAAGLLAGIDPARHPAALMQRASAFISEWRYAEAAPLLDAYVAGLEPGSYPRCVGLVNVAAARIHLEEPAAARKALAEARAQAEREGYALLLGNCLELGAQLEISERRWEKALAVLDEAWALLEDTRQSANALYILKWRAIARTLRARQVDPALAEVRAEAARLRHWETLRDCDYYAALATGDAALWTKLYFGTPHASYRARIERQAKVPDSLLWSGAGRPRAVVELASGVVEGPRRARLPAGYALHRLLILLAADLYRPAPLAGLFAGLFPGERFDPFSSPTRVRQLIRRLRRWLEGHRVRLDVEELDGGYRLAPRAGLAVRLARPAPPAPARELEFRALCAELKLAPGDRFTARDARERAEASRASVGRVLRWAVERGWLALEGKGPAARYVCRSLR